MCSHKNCNHTKTRLEVSPPSLAVCICVHATLVRVHLTTRRPACKHASVCCHFEKPTYSGVMLSCKWQEFILNRVLSTFGTSLIISFFPQRHIYVLRKSKSCSLWAFCTDLLQIFLLSALNCFLESWRACSHSANLKRMCVKFNLIQYNSTAIILNDSLPLKSIIQQTLNRLKLPGGPF